MEKHGKVGWNTIVDQYSGFYVFLVSFFTSTISTICTNTPFYPIFVLGRLGTNGPCGPRESIIVLHYPLCLDATRRVCVCVYIYIHRFFIVDMEIDMDSTLKMKLMIIIVIMGSLVIPSVTDRLIFFFVILILISSMVYGLSPYNPICSVS